MKRILTLALLFIMSVSLLSACGDSGNGGSSGNTGENTPQASGNSGSSKPTNNAAQESVAVEYDQVIYDDNDMKVTLTGYKYEPYSYMPDADYHYWYFTVENHTDQAMTTRFLYVSVNGCMYELEQPLVMTDAGETKESQERISLAGSELRARGITAIENFEFTLWFDEGSGAWTKYAVSEPITLPAPVPLNSGFNQNFDVDGVVILDEAGIKVTAIRSEHDIVYGSRHGMWVLIENNSGVLVHVVAVSTEINGGQYISGDLSCDVMNGKVAFDYVSFYKENLEDMGIDKLEDLAVLFYVDEWTTEKERGERLIEQSSGNTTAVTVTFDANGKAH